jgi:iron complex outermembrane receptor protein
MIHEFQLSISIAAILGALSGARVLAATAEAGSDALEEITVTAQRRSQSMQDVPISMQAFAGSSSIGTSRLRFENPAYTTFAASVGIAKDAWNATLFAENLANSHASTFTSTDQFIVEQTPLRPRVIGVSFGYKIP